MGLYNDCYVLYLLLSLLDFGVSGGCFCWSGVFHFVGGVSLVAFCVCGSGDWGNIYWRHSFFLFWHVGHPRLLVVLCFMVGAMEAAAHCSLCCFLCLRGCLWVSLFSLSFLPPSFQIYFLWLLKPAWFWWCGEAHCRKRVIPGGLYSSRCCGGSPLCPVLSFVTVGHWVIGRPRNKS